MTAACKIGKTTFMLMIYVSSSETIAKNNKIVVCNYKKASFRKSVTKELAKGSILKMEIQMLKVKQ